MHCTTMLIISNAIPLHCKTMLIIRNLIPLPCSTMLIISIIIPCTLHNYAYDKQLNANALQNYA